MTKNLNIQPNRDHFFADAKNLPIEQGDSYLLAYPHFLTFFEHTPILTEQDLVIGIHFTYGWMPTIFKFRDTRMLPSALEILNPLKTPNP